MATTAGASLPSWVPDTPTEVAPAVYVQALGSLGGADPETWPTFEGTFTGYLDTMRVTMYLTNEVYQRLNQTYPLIWQLSIDGIKVANYQPSAGNEKDLPMEPVGRGLSKIEFAITNLHEVLELYEFGTGDDVTHTLRLGMSALYFGDGNSVYWYDAVGYESKIDFNADVSDERFLVTYDVLG